MYIPRDAVFDETIFSFPKLYPNVGARLRAEISLLPNSLVNPSSVRADNVVDQSAISSTKQLHELSDDSPVQELGKMPDDAAPGEIRRDFVFPGRFGVDGSNTGHNVDFPRSPAVFVCESVLD